MAKSRLVVFDDGQGCFTPLCDLRAIFDQRTAACTTLERLERVLGLHAEVLVTPEELAEVTRHRHPDVTVNATPATWAADDEVWLINGRWLRPDAEILSLQNDSVANAELFSQFFTQIGVATLTPAELLPALREKTSLAQS